MRGEKRKAALDGAKPVKNSGRGFRKGDAVLDDSWLSLAATYRFTLLSSKKGFEVEATPKNIDIIVSSKSKNTRK